MRGMFYRCSSLKELNLNNFNTSNVTDMYYMFSDCSNEFKMKIKVKYKNLKEEAFDNVLYEDINLLDMDQRYIYNLLNLLIIG